LFPGFVWVVGFVLGLVVDFLCRGGG